MLVEFVAISNLFDGSSVTRPRFCLSCLPEFLKFEVSGEQVGYIVFYAYACFVAGLIAL